ncbi:MAG TPA: hypothetical protein VF486_28105, partial [Actinomycetes bacterium]
QVTAELTSIEPSLTYNADAAPANNNQIYVSASGSTVTLGSKSASGTCFYIKDVATGATPGTFYAKGTCTAPSATTVSGANW